MKRAAVFPRIEVSAGRSISRKSGVAVAVEGGVAEARLRDPRALQEEADLVLVGHADAAMHLDAFVADEKKRVAGLGLGDAREFARIAGAGVDRAQRRDHRRARELDLAEHLRGAMLQRLEGADAHAELLAVFEILHGALEGLAGAPQHLRGKGCPRPVENLLQELGAAIDRAEYGVRAEGDAVE